MMVAKSSYGGKGFWSVREGQEKKIHVRRCLGGEGGIWKASGKVGRRRGGGGGLVSFFSLTNFSREGTRRGNGQHFLFFSFIPYMAETACCSSTVHWVRRVPQYVCSGGRQSAVVVYHTCPPRSSSPSRNLCSIVTPRRAFLRSTKCRGTIKTIFLS